MTAQELKNSILQLAVQGKLVPQDTSDESASELLKRIRSFRADAIKNKSLSIDKKHATDPIAEDDIPYNLPNSWEWVRLPILLLSILAKLPQDMIQKVGVTEHMLGYQLPIWLLMVLHSAPRKRLARRQFQKAFRERYLLLEQ